MLVTSKAVALVTGLLLSGALGYGTMAADAPGVEGDELLPEAERTDGELDPTRDGRHVAIGLFMRWGFLEPPGRNGTGDDGLDVNVPSLDDPDRERVPMVPWDGFVQVTDGGVRLVRTVLWEEGGSYRLGTDDLVYPRRNPTALEWRSSTTVHWDGLLVVLHVPRNDMPVPHVTVHTDQWSYIFEAPDLVGLHVRLPVDRMGHEIELNGFLVEREGDEDFALFRMVMRWGHLERRTGDEVPDDVWILNQDDPVPSEGWNHTPHRAVPWDGFLSATQGRVRLIAPLLFESGGEYEHGADDRMYPRDNRFTLEWRSSTTVHWDGVAAYVLVPLRTLPEAHITLHTDSWSHIFEARQLVDLHVRLPVDSMGHEIEVFSDLVRRGP
jgi:hypothetical protein